MSVEGEIGCGVEGIVEGLARLGIFEGVSRRESAVSSA